MPPGREGLFEFESTQRSEGGGGSSLNSRKRRGLSAGGRTRVRENADQSEGGGSSSSSTSRSRERRAVREGVEFDFDGAEVWERLLARMTDICLVDADAKEHREL